jgi:allophanate hydrolase
MREASAAEIAAQVSSGARRAEQVAEGALARAAAYAEIQPQAWVRRTSAEEVLTAARAIDQRLAAGERLPLAGVPYAVKDNIDVAGQPTTAGCPEFAYSAERHATVVARLEAAGAVLLGKTNLDQFATGLVGTRSPYGAPRCVFNQEYVSGGSSSGSAVVVAAGVVPFALGSDTAGSGRVPAAFNGLVGFKPTRGRWSTLGLVPACRSLDCVSAFSARATDATLIDAVLAGFDPEDPYSRAPRTIPRVDGPLRLGFAAAGQLTFLGDVESPALYAAARERLLTHETTAVEVDIEPLLEAAQLLYAGPWVAERTLVLEKLLETRPSAVHPVVRAIVQAGRGLSAVDAFRGLHRLQELKRKSKHLWERIDVLVLPTAPTIYRLSEVLAEPVALNSNLGLYTNFANLLDMSVIAMPAGFRRNATGFGISLIGPAWADETLLQLAARYEPTLGEASRPALDRGGSARTVHLAVVGAHLAGMPLHWQLTAREARLAQRTHTAPVYRLYAMTDQSPPKPALVHVGAGGAAIEVEVYALSVEAFGSFVAEVPAPLAIGTVVLADGSSVRGFVAEPRALTAAQDITATGGWRAYLAMR